MHHNYNNSFFYGDDDVERNGKAMTFCPDNCAIEYIKEQRKKDKPFFLMLSWDLPTI